MEFNLNKALNKEADEVKAKEEVKEEIKEIRNIGIPHDELLELLDLNGLTHRLVNGKLYLTDYEVCRLKTYRKLGERWICTSAIIDAPEWHNLTNWRHLDEIYMFRPKLYKQWRSTGVIPYDKIREVEAKWANSLQQKT